MIKLEFKSCEFNIKDFGAAQCDALQTKEIQAALDACFLSGGGKVVVPYGVYLTGGLRLRSNTLLYLESGAVLKGSTNPEDYFGYKNDVIEPIDDYDTGLPRSVYPYSRWNNAIIRVIDAKNVAIVGEKNSYIDGSNCYDAMGEENFRGPHGINVQNSENIYLDGYTLKDCGNWAHAIFNTKGVETRNITVLGGHDGFDVRTCDDVIIEDSEFYTGDDCIAGFDNHDVVIRNCILNSSCSAMRFGGNGVLVENCRAFAPGKYGHRCSLSEEEKKQGAPTGKSARKNMLNAFLYYCDHRAKIRKAPGNILIRNCEFINPDSLFSLAFSENHVWSCNRSLSSIKFESCKVSGVCRPIYISGDEKEPLSFTLENVEISAREGSQNINLIEAQNYSLIKLNKVCAIGYHSPSILITTEGEIELTDTTPIKIIKGEALEDYNC